MSVPPSAERMPEPPRAERTVQTAPGPKDAPDAPAAAAPTDVAQPAPVAVDAALSGAAPAGAEAGTAETAETEDTRRRDAAEDSATSSLDLALPLPLSTIVASSPALNQAISACEPEQAGTSAPKAADAAAIGLAAAHMPALPPLTTPVAGDARPAQDSAVDQAKANPGSAPESAPAQPRSSDMGADDQGPGAGEAIARLATALTPASAAGGAAKTGAVQTSSGSKIKPADGRTETSENPLLAADPAALANKLGAVVASTTPQAFPTAIRRIGTEEAGAPGASEEDTRPTIPEDAPASGIPFTAALAGADHAGPVGPTSPGTSAATQGTSAVVDNVPLGNVPVEIGLKSLAGINQFEIRLAPDDLGRVDVRLHIDGEGRVKAHLFVERPETLAFLQRDTGQLQQALEQAGLKTQDGGIALSLRNSPSDSGFGQNRGGAGEGSSGRPDHSSRAAQDSGGGDALSGPTRRLLWPRPSGVDLHI